jgi:hypothetical protein
MFTVTNMKTGKKTHKTFEEFNRMVGSVLDELYFSDIFDSHMVEVKGTKYLVVKEK